MPAPRNHVGGYTDGALACVAGGRTPATSAAIDCFDTTSGTWESRPSLPTATSGAAATLMDGVTLVAGGEPSNETNLVDVVQELRGEHMVDAADARTPPRHRVRGLPRSPLDVRRRDRGGLPCGDRLHVGRDLKFGGRGGT